MVSERDIAWGGSGIERVLFDFILSRIKPGSTVVELGAGYVSTAALASVYNLYSVEHDAQFIGKVENVRYIAAPKIDGWYCVSCMRDGLPRIEEQKLVLIDGLNRDRIVKHMDLFNPNALFIVHDTYRKMERKLALRLGIILKREVHFHINGDRWASI